MRGISDLWYLIRAVFLSLGIYPNLDTRTRCQKSPAFVESCQLVVSKLRSWKRTMHLPPRYPAVPALGADQYWPTSRTQNSLAMKTFPRYQMNALGLQSQRYRGHEQCRCQGVWCKSVLTLRFRKIDINTPLHIIARDIARDTWPWEVTISSF